MALAYELYQNGKRNKVYIFLLSYINLGERLTRILFPLIKQFSSN